MDGLRLTFHLAGINNQNFLMRDEETGSYWQQVTGAAIAGPLAGRKLTWIAADELTLGLWKSEQPQGVILRDSPSDLPHYYDKDWDVKMKDTMTVLHFPEQGMGDRDLVLGIEAFGEARAYRYEQVLQEKLIRDRVGSESVILAVGPDGQSVRAFRDQGLEFYQLEPGVLMDSKSGGRWNFHGCPAAGGNCLERVNLTKDYWFDWRNYHPATTVFNGGGRAR